MTSCFPASNPVAALLALLLVLVPTAAGADGEGDRRDGARPARAGGEGDKGDGSKPAGAGERSKAFKAGARAYRAKKFRAAAGHFAEAFEQEGSKAALFAWAQAQRLAGDCKGAYFNYSRLLRRNPTSEQLEPVQYGMRSCEKKLGKSELGKIRKRLEELDRRERERDKQEALRQQREEIERKRRLARQERQRRLEADRREQQQTLALLEDEEPASRAPAYALLITGTVVALGGAGAFYLALDYRDRAAESYQDQLDNNDRAETWSLISTIGLASGGGLMAAGLIYWLATGPDDSPGERPVTLRSGPGDLGLAIGGRF